MEAARAETTGLRRLSDLSDYDIADDRPDVRRWTIESADGTDIGKVDDLVVDTSTMQVRYLELELDRKALHLGTDHDKHVIVPVERAHLDRDHKSVFVSGLTRDSAAALPEFTGGDYGSSSYDWSGAGTETSNRSGRLTRAEEELRIGTRRRQGEVRATKHVETERVHKEVPVRREEVTVERRPASGSTHDLRGAELGQGEVRVPIVEEEVTVEKRPVVKEEVVIGKQTHVETKGVDAEVRRERVDVDKSGTDAGRDADLPRSRVK